MTWMVLANKRSSVPLYIRLVLLVYLKVLVLLEGRVQSEHHVQRLHQRIRQARVNWNIQNVARHSAVVSNG